MSSMKKGRFSYRTQSLSCTELSVCVNLRSEYDYKKNMCIIDTC